MTYRFLVALALVACVDPRTVQQTLDETESIIEQANAVHARICAPEHIANAESGVEFVALEYRQGSVQRAHDHVTFAHAEAKLALEIATPCGTADRDQDTIVDLFDQCPDEPEDFDGVDDADGCEDIDPNGDEDADGILNKDDACMYEPEDLDGHDDEDGCPEESADTDGDGLIDALDACPEEPEDVDNFRDADGCPDPDNDSDTVLDVQDSCIDVPEDLDGWEDEDGCPEEDNDLDGILDLDDACPDVAGDIAYNGCPPTDRDGDLIEDLQDKCPDEPGIPEKQGCPETDRDKDGFVDDVDKCPDDPETVNDYLDDDGCPDVKPQRVKVTRTMVEITDTILFDTGKATIKAESFPILDDVKQVLLDRPSMELRIEGHTDSQGSDVFNMSLSRDRAASVRQYLVDGGIEGARLDSKGYGETSPIDTNRTAEGRQRNRRVEFHITMQ